MRQVQGGDVAGKILRDGAQGEVAAVCSAVLHAAGSLLYGGGAVIRTHSDGANKDDPCRDAGSSCMQHFKETLRRQNKAECNVRKVQKVIENMKLHLKNKNLYRVVFFVYGAMLYKCHLNACS